jgi:hypothetical protein
MKQVIKVRGLTRNEVPESLSDTADIDTWRTVRKSIVKETTTIIKTFLKVNEYQDYKVFDIEEYKINDDVPIIGWEFRFPLNSSYSRNITRMAFDDIFTPMPSINYFKFETFVEE